MGFKVVTSDAGAGNSNKSGGNNDFDLDAFLAKQQEAIVLMETENASENLAGVVSGYIDLGIQPRGDYEEEYDPSDEKLAKKLENGSFLDTRYNSDKKKRMEMLCTPRTPAKAFALSVDFPEYLQEFTFDDKTVKKPYRMYMGGNWSVIDPEGDGQKKMKMIQQQFSMVENTNNPQDKWALGTGTNISKMCVAAGLGDEHGLVSKDSIVELLGKTLLFEVRVWNKPAKNDASKSYFTEHIKFVGKLAKGQSPLELPEGTEVWGVNFAEENDPEMLKQVRAIAKNTMKLATNWENSVIRKELFNKGKGDNSIEGAEKPEEKTPPKPESNPVQKAAEPQKKEPVLDDGWDDDL